MRNRITAIAIAIALVLGSSSAMASPIIHEDSPYWDCRTMGNRICGEWHSGSGSYQNRKYWAIDGASQ